MKKKLTAFIAITLIAFFTYSCNCNSCGKKEVKNTNETACCSNNANNTDETCCSTNSNSCKMNKKIVISAQSEVKPEMVDKFLTEVEDLVTKSRAEEGCISYTLYADVKEKNKFFFFEEWKDQAAIDAHFNAEHFKKFGELMDEIALVPNKIKIFEVSGEK